jgi:transposase
MQLPPVFEFQKQQLLDQVEYYKSLIHKADGQIEKYLQQFPETQSLRELPGIGKFSAALIIAEIGRVERFSNPKQLVSYAGLAPGLYESGQTSHSRGITHQGSKYLRWILCEAAHRHIRKPGPLKDFYLRLRPAKGHGKALIATARKLLVRIYYILKDKKLQVTLDMPASVPGLS